MIECGASVYEGREPKPEKGPQARAGARGERPRGWARAEKAGCDSVLYAEVLERIVKTVQGYTSVLKRRVYVMHCTLAAAMPGVVGSSVDLCTEWASVCGLSVRYSF